VGRQGEGFRLADRDGKVPAACYLLQHDVLRTDSSSAAPSPTTLAIRISTWPTVAVVWRPPSLTRQAIFLP
jgi:hypothetical protein